MKRKTKASQTGRGKRNANSVHAGTRLEKVLAVIKARSDILPSEINRHLKLAQSNAPRAALLSRGLIRKDKDGSVVRYYSL